jgi:hypothetical protein
LKLALGIRVLSGALFGPTVHLAWYHGKKIKPPNPFKLLLNIRNSPRFVVMGPINFFLIGLASVILCLDSL